MMKVLTPSVAIFILISVFFGCSKSNNNPTPTPTPAVTDKYKISLVSGNGQSGAIGYGLKDSIVVKVTDNNDVATGVQVQFVGPGCSEDLVTNVNSKSDGTASYFWALAGTQGQQALRAVIVVSGKRIDSVSINATAMTALSLSLTPKSACTPNVGYAEHFAILSTGRLLACFGGTTSIRYSDDNGSTWNPVKSFGAGNAVSLIRVTPKDGIFAATLTDGLFYSADAGNTWANISPPDYNKQSGVYDMTYTKSGKLIVLSAPSNVFITTDNGNTWTSSTGTGLTAGTSYSNPVELNNGDLYVVSLSSIMFKSTDKGQNWTAIPNAPNELVSTIYFDNNRGWLYKVTIDNSTTPSTTISASTDNGASFVTILVYSKPSQQPFLVDMSIQSDGRLYFETLGFEIDVQTSSGLPDSVVPIDLAFAPYILAQNGNFVYATSKGVFYR